MTRTKTFKLEELAAAAGVSPRTVRYYVQRGLLPAPEFRGRDTAYDGEHLSRLRAIRKLQAQHLPLDAIQVELSRRSASELDALPEPAAPGTLPPPEPRAEARGEPLHRHALAPGVDLIVSERVGLSQALVEELRSLIERHTKGRHT